MLEKTLCFFPFGRRFYLRGGMFTVGGMILGIRLAVQRFKDSKLRETVVSRSDGVLPRPIYPAGSTCVVRM
jgi:hypothetical protein